MSSQPELSVPASNAIVDVKLIHGGNVTVNKTAIFWGPVLSGREKNKVPAWCFLIENNAQNKRVMFDLGTAKDTRLWPASVVAQLPLFTIDVEKDVATQLKEGGVPLESVDAVIWR